MLEYGAGLLAVFVNHGNPILKSSLQLLCLMTDRWVYRNSSWENSHGQSRNSRKFRDFSKFARNSCPLLPEIRTHRRRPALGRSIEDQARGCGPVVSTFQAA